MNNETKELVVREDVAQLDLIEQLKNPQGNFFCTIKDDGTRKSKVAIYNAINMTEDSLADHINEVLEITDVIAFPVSLVDENTGEVFQALKTILIDKNKKSYGAVSQGITNSLSRIFSIVGMPPWTDEPIKMKIKQIKTRNGDNKVNTIELV